MHQSRICIKGHLRASAWVLNSAMLNYWLPECYGIPPQHFSCGWGIGRFSWLLVVFPFWGGRVGRMRSSQQWMIQGWGSRRVGPGIHLRYRHQYPSSTSCLLHIQYYNYYLLSKGIVEHNYQLRNRNANKVYMLKNNNKSSLVGVPITEKTQQLSQRTSKWTKVDGGRTILGLKIGSGSLSELSPLKVQQDGTWRQRVNAVSLDLSVLLYL